VVGFDTAVGESGLVEIGERCAEGGECRDDLGARRWAIVPGVGADEHRPQGGGRPFGVIDESDHTGVVEPGQDSSLVPKAGSIVGLGGGADREESAGILRDGEDRGCRRSAHEQSVSWKYMKSNQKRAEYGGRCDSLTG